MDLAASADALHDRANRIYEWKFLRGLKKRIERKATLYPGRYDTKYLRGLGSLREFDDQITARYCGFQDSQDYYTRAASTQVLDRIAVPTLILHADDDPFIRVLPGTREKLSQNQHITYVETASGGHCAFLAEPNGYDGRWAERQAIAFLQRVERGESVIAPAWARRLMDADWSVELGADDAALEFPWSSPDGSMHYVDLLRSPDWLTAIPEAKQFPELGEFLLAINESTSPG